MSERIFDLRFTVFQDNQSTHVNMRALIAAARARLDELEHDMPTAFPSFREVGTISQCADETELTADSL